VGITQAVTKWNCQVKRTEEIPGAIAKAFYIARSGRPGPVVVARNLFGALDLTVPFGDGLRDAHEIGLLKGVGAQQRRTDLSGYEHQRRGVHQRVGESRHGVGGAGAGGDQTDPHAAADAGVALRGVYGALFVPHEDVAQAVAVVAQCVVDGDDRPAGVAENRIDALAQERFDQGLRSRDGGTGLRFGHVCLRRIHDCCCFTYSSSTMRTAPLSAELTSLSRVARYAF